MIAAFAMVLGALIVSTLGPQPLIRLTHSQCDPRAVIGAWVFSITGALVAGVAGVVLFALPRHGGLGDTLGLAGDCISAVSEGVMPRWEEASAVVAVVMVLALLIRLAVVAARQVSAVCRRRAEYRSLLWLVSPDRSDGQAVLWIDRDDPLAFSVGGNPGLVILTRGTRDRLSTAALAATLEHERAHLRGRHHLLLGIADVAAAALPFVPLFRLAPRALRELVEVAADVPAVRKYGTEAVCEALLALAHVRPQTPGLAMADTAIERRVARLRSGRPVPRALRRNLLCGVAVVTATTGPSLLGLAFFLSVACAMP